MGMPGDLENRAAAPLAHNVGGNFHLNIQDGIKMPNILINRIFGGNFFTSAAFHEK
jgi:hypothetical protein